MTDDRHRLAANLLQEAVYQSRARQANQIAFSEGSLDGPSGAGCGLGDETAVDLDLTERGEQLLHEIWPGPIARTRLEHIRTVMRDWVERITPQGRLGDVKDLVGTAIFLASEAAAFINGQTIRVDGGITAETAPAVARAGADVLVAGSAVFRGAADAYRGNIESIRRAAMTMAA